jgi:hypothetical protein
MDDLEGFEVFDGYHSRYPERVQLLYSRSTQKIGIRPAPLGSSIDFTVRKQKNCRNCIISGKAFLKEYSIDCSVTRRFEATLQDEKLIIDLNGPNAVVTGPRKGKKRPVESEVEAMKNDEK